MASDVKLYTSLMKTKGDEDIDEFHKYMGWDVASLGKCRKHQNGLSSPDMLVSRN